MLNPQTGGPASAGPMASYLFSQVAKPEMPDWDLLVLGAQVHVGEVEYHVALERLIEQEVTDLRGELQDRLDGLRTAFQAVGEGAFVRAVDGLSSATDAPEFDRLAEGLAVAVAASAQSEWYRAVQQLRETHADLHDQAMVVDHASSRLAFALYRAEYPEPDLTAGVRYRPDTDPRLAAKLGFDPNAIPTRQLVGNLMRANDALNRPVPGKMYRSANATSEPVGYLALVFPMSKGASVAWALAAPEEQALIMSAHRAALTTAMEKVDNLIGYVRTGDGGKQTERAHITWIEFDHPTARAAGHQSVDPYFHTHVIVPNVTLSASRDKVGSLHTVRLHNQFADLRQTYRISLAEGLRTRGIEADYDANKRDVVLEGIPAHITEAMSKRTVQARLSAAEYLAKEGITIERLPAAQQARHIVNGAEATRRGNGASTPNPSSWQRQVRDLGWRLTHVISESFRLAQRLAVQDRAARKHSHHAPGIELEQGHSQFRGHLIEEDDLLRPPSLRL